MGAALSEWYVPYGLLRLAILVGAAVAIPTLVWKRVGGKAVSHTALMLGVATLIGAEVLRLASDLYPGWSAAISTVAGQFPIHAAGFVLLLIGFASLMHDLKRMQVAASRDTATEHARAEEARLQEAKLRAILNGATDYCIISCDAEGLVTSYSDGGARILGWTPDDVVGRMNVSDLHAPAAEFRAADVMATVARQGRFEAEVPLARKGGGTVPVLLTVTPLAGPDGDLQGYIGIAKDIAEMKEARDALRRERDFVQGIIETSELFIVGVSLADGRITMFNHGAELISGYRRDEVIGRQYATVFLPEEDRPRLWATLERIGNGAQSPRGQYDSTIVTSGGDRRLIAWTYAASADEGGRPESAVGFGRDVTEQRRMQASLEQAKADLEQANAALQRLATTDYLTGLLNRRQADLLLEREMARAQRTRTPVGVILLDLDHFKAINDTHGHEVGDVCLRHVAEHLRGRLRASDITARYGGEEFLVVLPETGRDDTAMLADLICRRIEAAAVVHGDLRVHLSTSAGVAVLEPGQDLSADELVRRADEAMYCAKGLGGNRAVTWNQTHRDKADLCLATTRQIRELQKQVEAVALRNREGFMEDLARLVADLEAQSPYTDRHSQHVAEYAVAIARHMLWTEAEIETLRHAAVLHDLGKSAVPGEILWRNEPLSKSQWDLVRQLPAATTTIFERVPFLSREALLIRHCHERPDGRGYPDGLTGDAIPAGSRILAVADALDAMTRDRPYRAACGLDEALERLAAGVDTQFDADVVAAALAVARRASRWPLAASAQPETQAAAS